MLENTIQPTFNDKFDPEDAKVMRDYIQKIKNINNELK